LDDLSGIRSIIWFDIGWRREDGWWLKEYAEISSFGDECIGEYY